MSEISPAPWNSHHEFVHDNDGHIIGQFYGPLSAEGMTYANARLVAAAPELLKELKDLIHQIETALS